MFFMKVFYAIVFVLLLLASNSSFALSDEKNKLVSDLMKVTGQDVCSNMLQIYALTSLLHQPPSVIAERFAKNKEEKVAYVKTLLDISKYGFDSSSCLAMFYEDITANEMVSGYYFYIIRKKFFKSQSLDALKQAKEYFDKEAQQAKE